MEKKHTVNVYAKLFGVSVESIRHYRSRGILNPEQSGGAGYHKYGFRDSSVVFTIRQLRKFGFSLEEIACALGTAAEDEYLQLFNERREALINDIEESKRVLGCLESKIEQMRSLTEKEERFKVVMRPAFWFHAIRVDTKIYDSVCDVEATSKWNEMTPQVDSAIVWPLAALKGSGEKYSGHIVCAESVKDVPEGHAVFYPEQRCIYASKRCKGDLACWLDTIFDELLDHIEGEGICPVGDAIARRVRTFKGDDGEYNYDYQLYVPI